MIYDCFTFNGELDILEIRLNILDTYVDKFVICEARDTFQGHYKPLYYEENQERFSKWNDKIIYYISPQYSSDTIPTAFDLAAFQKDSIREALKDCEPEDVIYYGDVDEIWKPQEKEGKLRQLAYSYYLNNRSSEDWQGTNVFKYKNIRDLNDIRADHSVVLEDGGWHFTNMGGYEALIKKIESYDHQEVNIPWVKDGLKARMEANIDFLGRTHDWKGNEFKMWIDETDLPKYLLENKAKYSHLWR
jgi:beta-1,4-mannosyl-glycoprotein beta-1,4-N-acetylglucosaminyltransferase